MWQKKFRQGAFFGRGGRVNGSSGDIGGNKFRLVARVSYEYKRVMVKFIGTHKDYDDIDPETV